MLVLGAIGPTHHEEEKIVCGRYPTTLTRNGVIEGNNLITLITEMFPPGEKMNFHLPQMCTDDDFEGDDAVGQFRDIIEKRVKKYVINHDPLINNRSHGEYDNVHLSVLRKHLAPREYRLWDRDFFESAKGGESLQDVTERTGKFIQCLVDDDNKDHVIITYPDVIKTIIAHVSGTDEFEVPHMNIEYGVPYILREF